LLREVAIASGVRLPSETSKRTESRASSHRFSTKPALHELRGEDLKDGDPRECREEAGRDCHEAERSDMRQVGNGECHRDQRQRRVYHTSNTGDSGEGLSSLPSRLVVRTYEKSEEGQAQESSRRQVA
jgi:hypothetical protein